MPSWRDLQVYFHYRVASLFLRLRRDEWAAGAWDALGTAFGELGRWKDALPCQERAMRLAPSADHAFNLATTLYELHRLDEAERVVRDALVYDPKSVVVKELLAHVLAGQDRHEEAITLAREICESNPDAPSSRAVLAGVLTEAGHLDEALTEAKAAVEFAPTDARCHCVLGGLYVKMNDGAARHDEAMLAFEELLRIDGEFFERWPELAPHYERSTRAGRP